MGIRWPTSVSHDLEVLQCAGQVHKLCFGDMIGSGLLLLYTTFNYKLCTENRLGMRIVIIYHITLPTLQCYRIAHAQLRIYAMMRRDGETDCDPCNIGEQNANAHSSTFTALLCVTSKQRKIWGNCIIYNTCVS